MSTDVLGAERRAKDRTVERESDPTASPVLGRLGHRGAPHVVYLLAAVGTWPWLARGRPGPDAVSYFSIARSWADGRWSDALNAFWSPLVSWLLVPAAWLDLPLVEASFVLSIAIGSFAIWRLQVLLDRLGVPAHLSGILVISVVPFLLHAVYGSFTPDLLMASMLLGYVGALIDPDDTRRGVRIGGWTAAAFLAKAYALPFVLAHLVCWVTIRLWRRAAIADALRTAAVSCSVVGAIILAWMIPLSISYGTPTLSTTATYHLSVATPGSPGNGFGWAGLLEPPNEFAVSAWEEPSLAPYDRSSQPDAADAGDDGDTGDADGRLVRIGRNAADAAFAGASLAGIVLLAAIAAVVVGAGARRRSSREPVVHLVSAAAVYTSGLLLLFVDRRYMFFVLLLAVTIAASFISRVVEPRRGRVAAAVVAVIVGLASMPLSVVALTRVAERATVDAAVDAEFEAVLSAGDRVASSTMELHALSAACFRIGCTWLGSPVNDRGADLATELCGHDVDVFLTDDAAVDLPSPARRLNDAPNTFESAWRMGCDETPLVSNFQPQ